MDSAETNIANPSDLRRKKRYKQLLVVVFVIFNIAIIFWTARKEFTRDQNAPAPAHLPWWLLVPAALSFLAAVFAEVWKYTLLIERFTKKKDFTLARQVVLLGKYYDNITPSAIGGQPMQILHMRKHGVPSEYAAMIPIIGFVSTQLAFVALAFIMILIGKNLVLSDVVYAASYVGILLYAFFPVSIVLFALAPKVTNRFVGSVLLLFHKVRIVKDIDKTREKVFGEIAKYAKCIKAVIRDKKLLGKVMGLSVVYQLGMVSIPFFVVTAFGGGVGYLPATLTCIAILAAIAFIPTPGNAGAAEGSFFLVFSALPSGNTFWPMIVWRFFTYYSFIAAGALTYLEMGFKNRKKMLK